MTKPEDEPLLAKIARLWGNIPAKKVIPTLQATSWKQSGDPLTEQQMMACLVVAWQHRLNPFSKEIYAFPDKQGAIVPVVSIDGWNRIANDHPQFDGMTFAESPDWVEIPGAKNCPTWMEVSIFRKDREHPIVIREYLDEVYREASSRYGKPKPGPWQTHTKRMLRHKTIIQGLRVAFSFSGIYDRDEAESIVEGQFQGVEDKPVELDEAVQEILNKAPKESASYPREEFNRDIDMGVHIGGLYARLEGMTDPGECDSLYDETDGMSGPDISKLGKAIEARKKAIEKAAKEAAKA